MPMPRPVLVSALAFAAVGAVAAAPGTAPGSTPAGSGTAEQPRPAAGTREGVARPIQPIPFTPGEEIELDIDYRSVHSAKAKLTVGRPEGAIWPMIWTARTDGVASIFDVRVHYVSFWDSRSGLARGSDLNVIEVNDRHTDRLRFDRDAGQARLAVLRKGELREHTQAVPPDAQEVAGALLRVRAGPLTPGAKFEYPVFSGQDAFTLRAEVQGREVVQTPAGRFETVRVAVQLGFTGRFATKGPSYVWVSTDDRHVPVRMSADFEVGSINVTLSAYRPGGPFVASDPR